MGDEALTSGTNPTRTEVSELLEAWRAGDPEAPDRLFPLVYGELKAMAGRRRHTPGETLQTTALVHETYLKLVDAKRAGYVDRGHFFAVAAHAMRHILVDAARRRAALKRGGDARRTDFDEGKLPVAERAAEVVALDGALATLEELDPRLGRIVEMRFFAGLSVEETAKALSISPATVKRAWRKARAFLNRELAGEPE